MTRDTTKPAFLTWRSKDLYRLKTTYLIYCPFGETKVQNKWQEVFFLFTFVRKEPQDKSISAGLGMSHSTDYAVMQKFLIFWTTLLCQPVVPSSLMFKNLYPFFAFFVAAKHNPCWTHWCLDLNVNKCCCDSVEQESFHIHLFRLVSHGVFHCKCLSLLVWQFLESLQFEYSPL